MATAPSCTDSTPSMASQSAPTDWSDIFEKRLLKMLKDSGKENQSVANENKSEEERKTGQRPRAGIGLDSAMATPPSTIKRPASNATDAFFESIRKKSRCEAMKDTSRILEVSGGAETTETAETAATTERAEKAEITETTETAATTERAEKAEITEAAETTETAETAEPCFVFDKAGRPVLQGLQENYSRRAEDLHEQAMQQLAEVQDTLEKQLDSLELQDDAFLSEVSSRQALFNKAPSEWILKIQIRQQGGRGAPIEREERITDRVAAMRTAAATLETDLEQLWKAWDEAHLAFTAILEEIFGRHSGVSDLAADTNSGDKIVSEAEEELEAAAAEALAETRDNEKAFRKLILAEECKLAQSMLARQSKYD